MRAVVKSGLVVGGVLLLAVGLVTLVGSMLPVGHVASRSRILDRRADAVWQVIRDIERYPAWWSAVDTVTADTVTEAETWRLHMGWRGILPVRVTRADAPVRLVTAIADTTLPFGGTWTYEIVPVDGASRITVTERGRITSPPFRFIARYMLGYTGTIDSYLSALAERVGAQADGAR